MTIVEREDSILAEVNPRIIEASRAAAANISALWQDLEARGAGLLYRLGRNKVVDQGLVISFDGVQMRFEASVGLQRNPSRTRFVETRLYLEKPTSSQTVVLESARLSFCLEGEGLVLRAVDFRHKLGENNVWLLRSMFEVSDSVVLRTRQHVVPRCYFRTYERRTQACSFTLVPSMRGKSFTEAKMSVGILSEDNYHIRPPKRTVGNPEQIAGALLNMSLFLPATRPRPK